MTMCSIRLHVLTRHIGRYMWMGGFATQVRNAPDISRRRVKTQLVDHKFTVFTNKLQSLQIFRNKCRMLSREISRRSPNPDVSGPCGAFDLGM